MPRPSSRARWWLIAAAGAVVVVIVAAVLVVVLHKPGNVSHPDLSFTAPRTTPTVTTQPKKKVVVRVDRFEWRLYGYNFARTRDFTGRSNLHPPFRRGWSFGGNALIEFPPSIYGHALFFMDDGATVKSINARTGKQFWATHLGKLSAASPALDVKRSLLYVPTLSDTSLTPGNGEFAAVSMRTGHVVWTRPVASGSESSPLVANGLVYFGSQSGTVYALAASTGRVVWTYQASGAVKGGVALSRGIVYFADYAGRVYALNAKDGRTVWTASTSGAEFGFGSGTFYSTPAVAFGRVYVGNTDGFVYSFAARTGQLAWKTSTGAYVYSSAAVADTPGLGPTVYMGSYNGYFYAFNAQSGAIRWSHYDGNRISGSATIVNNVVYYSDLDDKRTTGLNARTGGVVFKFHDGAFSPVIADPSTLFLTGFNVVYELIPKTRP